MSVGGSELFSFSRFGKKTKHDVLDELPLPKKNRKLGGTRRMVWSVLTLSYFPGTEVA